MQLCLQWPTTVTLLWPTVLRLPEPLVQRAGSTWTLHSHHAHALAPYLVLHKGQTDVAGYNQLTCLGSAQTLKCSFTLQHSLEASGLRYLHKLWPCLVSSPVFLPFLHLISGFSAEHFPCTTILSSESASGKLNLKHFALSSHCTLYFHLILLNSRAIDCSKSVLLLVH